MTEKRLIVIQPDSEVTLRPLDGLPGLQDLQGLVGGDIELVPFFTEFEREPCVVFCNQTGKLDGLEINHCATAFWRAAALWHAQGEPRFIGRDYLVGPIVIITGPHSFLRQL
jgi:hypothetical protein